MKTRPYSQSDARFGSVHAVVTKGYKHKYNTSFVERQIPPSSRIWFRLEPRGVLIFIYSLKHSIDLFDQPCVTLLLMEK